MPKSRGIGGVPFNYQAKLKAALQVTDAPAGRFLGGFLRLVAGEHDGARTLDGANEAFAPEEGERVAHDRPGHLERFCQFVLGRQPAVGPIASLANAQ
jgi:hypothetical protein